MCVLSSKRRHRERVGIGKVEYRRIQRRVMMSYYTRRHSFHRSIILCSCLIIFLKLLSPCNSFQPNSSSIRGIISLNEKTSQHDNDIKIWKPEVSPQLLKTMVNMGLFSVGLFSTQIMTSPQISHKPSSYVALAAETSKDDPIITKIHSIPTQTNRRQHQFVSEFMESISPPSSISSSSIILNEAQPAIGGIDTQLLRQSLVPPTDDRPQIQPVAPSQSLTSPRSITSSGANEKQKKAPIMQGMVYLQTSSSKANVQMKEDETLISNQSPSRIRAEEVRPDPSDILVLTVSTPTDPNTILAGAKIPIYRVNRFPFQFQMYSPNILKGREQQFWDVNGNGDYIVQGRICRQIEEEVTTSVISSDSMWSSPIVSTSATTASTTTSSTSTRGTSQSERSLPCTESESIFVGTGVSKLLKNVPGLEEGDVIRTAVSVPLSKTK